MKQNASKGFFCMSSPSRMWFIVDRGPTTDEYNDGIHNTLFGYGVVKRYPQSLCQDSRAQQQPQSNFQQTQWWWSIEKVRPWRSKKDWRCNVVVQIYLPRKGRYLLTPLWRRQVVESCSCKGLVYDQFRRPVYYPNTEWIMTHSRYEWLQFRHEYI